MKYYAVSSSSMSHTFGNVTAFITEYVKSLFPINYFRTVNISSTMAYREFNIFNNLSRYSLSTNSLMQNISYQYL